jgi:hypothetical protein
VSGKHFASAQVAWNNQAPDWIEVLANECDRTSQPAVARRLEISTSTLNETMRNKYKGRVDRIEAKVRGAYMGATVMCPVIGEIPTDQCLYHQKRPFSAANPTRVALHRACPTCPNFRPSASQSSPVSKPEE